ncbi:DUF6611 family protein [Leifsonia sp. A12D58]|uniref:DUF6611 family protein n=1 Tax=Leifsonia sp. A12D58 TaxID=3397674 RepID=UPI0039E18795
MNEKSTVGTRVHSWTRRQLTLFLDGPQRWGDFQTSVGRYGTIRHVLVLYPPGTNTEQRRLLRSCERWRALGPLVACAAFLALALANAPWILAVLAAVASYALGIAITDLRAGPPHRAHVVRLTAAESTLSPDPDNTEECAYLIRLAAILTAADEALDGGVTSAVVHERIWGAVYDEAKEHLDQRVPSRQR